MRLPWRQMTVVLGLWLVSCALFSGYVGCAPAADRAEENGVGAPDGSFRKPYSPPPKYEDEELDSYVCYARRE